MKSFKAILCLALSAMLLLGGMAMAEEASLAGTYLLDAAPLRL